MSPRAGKRLGAAGAALLAALLLAALFLDARRGSGDGAGALRTVTWWDMFDTVTVITGYADTDDAWAAQTRALHDDLMHYHRLFDIYNHYDGMVNLYDVNRAAAAAPVDVSGDLMGLLTFGQQAYTLTGGACNIAAGRVLALWHDARTAAGDLATGETATAALLPDEAALAEAAAHISIDDLVLDADAGTVAFTDPELQLDVGSIGKGYAVEMAAQAAEARGVTSMLINAGGNVRAIGTKPDGSRWTAGVENPWPDADGSYSTASYVAAVELQPGQSLVVSGDYQRYFVVDGVRYHHLIDLGTLQPARYVSSVAVLCSSSAYGDALSTGLFCQPVESGLAIVNGLDGAEALWMQTDGSMTASDGWPS